MKRLNYLAVVPLAASLAQPAVAQEEETDLGTVVVSGGLTPIESSAFGRASTVITGEEIERSGQRYVADVLRRVPGVAVSRSGAFGGLTQVRIRGNEGNATKVFIDGIDVSNPAFGEFDFGGLLTSDIERIEVLRGPQSSIFGSNAAAGVISITTKRATEPGVSGSALVEYGGEETISVSGAGRYAGPRGDLSLSISRFETEGFDISDTNNGSSAFRDGTENTTFSANGRYFLTDTATVGGVLRYTDRSVDSDDDVFGAPSIDQVVANANNENDVTTLYGLAYLEMDVLDGRMRNRFDFSFVDEESEGFTDGAQTFGNESDRRRLTYTGTVALDAATVDAANQTLSFSYQWQEETFQQTFQPAFAVPPSFFQEQERTQNSFVLEYRGSFSDVFDLQASVRYDDNEEFDNFTSYSVGASYVIPQTDTRLRASIGTGSVNPDFFQQFGFFNNFVGNPDLDPEDSFGWDIGVEQTILNGRGLIGLTYFQEEVDNEIGSETVGGVTRPVNDDGVSDRQGIEFTALVEFSDALDMSLNYTWLDAENADGSIEIRRPEHELFFEVGYSLPNGRTRLTGDVQYVSGLFDNDFTAAGLAGTGVRELSDYTLVNVAARHQINDRLTLTGSITNLTDENYQEISGFATQGRTFYVGLAATF